MFIIGQNWLKRSERDRWMEKEQMQHQIYSTSPPSFTLVSRQPCYLTYSSLSFQFSVIPRDDLSNIFNHTIVFVGLKYTSIPSFNVLTLSFNRAGCPKKGDQMVSVDNLRTVWGSDFPLGRYLMIYNSVVLFHSTIPFLTTLTLSSPYPLYLQPTLFALNITWQKGQWHPYGSLACLLVTNHDPSPWSTILRPRPLWPIIQQIL